MDEGIALKAGIENIFADLKVAFDSMTLFAGEAIAIFAFGAAVNVVSKSKVNCVCAARSTPCAQPAVSIQR